MTDLMRNNLRPLFEKTSSAHAGLLIQRGLKKWEDGDKPAKKSLVQKITSVQATDLYLLAFKRWLAHSYENNDNHNFATISAKVDGRLMTGLPLGGTLETGVTTHHTYGMPIIAGSSIKGAVRNYTEYVFAERNENGEIIIPLQITKEKQDILNVLFGSDNDETPNAGYLIWYDAWWIPPTTSDFKLSTGDQNKPFIEDVITVHHQDYYANKLPEALDIENPIPNQQVAVQGNFYFVIEGVSAWVQYAKKLLEQTIQQQGLGAKSSAGYGYFIEDTKLADSLQKLYVKTILATGNGEPSDPVATAIQFLSADELVLKLSKDSGKFFKELALNKEKAEDKQKVAKFVLEYHSKVVDSWANDNKGGNMEKALKFVKNNS